MGLISCWAKYRTRFLNRLHLQSGFDGTFTVSWLRKRNIQPGSANHPYMHICPCEEPRKGINHLKGAFTLKDLSDNAASPKQMPIVKNGQQYIGRLCGGTLQKHHPSVGYCTLVQGDSWRHTNEWANAFIMMSSTDGCNACDRKYTLSHSLTWSGVGREKWALVNPSLQEC
jgi:hypothetical protein